MATDGLRAGWEGRLGIILYDATGAIDTASGYSSVPRYFAVKRWEFNPKNPTLDASNTEGKPGRPGASLAPGYQSRLKNLKSCDIRLEQAAYDDGADPFSTAPSGAGYNLREGKYVKVFVWPDRDDAPDTTKAHSAEGIITDMRYTGEVGGNQAVSISIESDGNYNLV